MGTIVSTGLTIYNFATYAGEFDSNHVGSTKTMPSCEGGNSECVTWEFENDGYCWQDDGCVTIRKARVINFWIYETGNVKGSNSNKVFVRIPPLFGRFGSQRLPEIQVQSRLRPRFQGRDGTVRRNPRLEYTGCCFLRDRGP